MLTNDQQRTRLDISRYHQSRHEHDPGDFIEHIVTQDETWVQHFDPESKMQSKQWKHSGSPHPKEFKKVNSSGKVMTSIFNSQGVMIIDYLEQVRTINGAYYTGVFRRLRQEIAKLRRKKLTHSVLLLQVNAIAHTLQFVMTTVTECGFEMLSQPPPHILNNTIQYKFYL